MNNFDLFFFEQHFEKGVCRFKEGDNTISMLEKEDGYQIRIEPPAPNMVCHLQTYYTDSLTLNTEGDYLKLGGARIGVWKIYDPYGSMVEEKDYEDGYKIHWEQLLEIMERDKINLKSLMGISRYEYKKENNNETEDPIKCWGLTLIQAGTLRVHAIYDGVTGELLDVDAKGML